MLAGPCAARWLRKALFLPFSMRNSIVIAAIFIASLPCAFAAKGKVERIDRPADSPVAAAVWNVLDAKGYQLTLDDGSTACNLWLRKNLLPAAILFCEYLPPQILTPARNSSLRKW